MCGELVSMRKTASSIFYHRLHIHKRERGNYKFLRKAQDVMKVNSNIIKI